MLRIGIVAAAVGLAACGYGDDVLVVVQNQVPDRSCTVSDDPTVYRTGGVLDVAYDPPLPYVLYPLVENRLPTAGTSQGRSVVTDGVSVTIRPPPGPIVSFPASCPASYVWPNAVTIDAGDRRVLIAEVISSCAAAEVKRLFENMTYSTDPAVDVFFTVDVRARGRLDGDVVTSAAFSYPVKVCYGCLQVAFGERPPDCASLTENPYPGNPCNPAQDAPMLCCLDGSKAVCPAGSR